MYLGQKEIKFNPLALISGCFWMVPGLFLGQLSGTFFSLTYAIAFTLCCGLATGLIGYFVNLKTPQTASDLYRTVAESMALILGAICGGANIGTMLFLFKILLPTKLALGIGIIAGALGGAAVIRFLIRIKKIQTPNSIIVLAASFIGMILMSCFGSFYGPLGWGLGLDLGVLVGFVIGRLAIVAKDSSNALAKILSSLYAISGMMVGIMFGTIFNAFVVTIIPQALIYTAFGFFLMGSGAWIGHIMGNSIKFNPECALRNAVLRHRLYQAALLIPVIFSGYLAGGILGLYYYSFAQIVLCQAYGTVISGSLYAVSNFAYYFIQGIKNKYKIGQCVDEDHHHECFLSEHAHSANHSYPAAVFSSPCTPPPTPPTPPTTPATTSGSKTLINSGPVVAGGRADSATPISRARA